MANPFFIEPANPLQALMMGVQGYDRSQKATKQAEQEAVFKDVGQQIQSGGLDNTALGQLFGLGVPAAPMLNAAAALSRAKMEGQGVYGTPIYGVDENNKTVLGAITKDGKFKPLDTGNVTVTPGIKLADTGTAIIPFNSRTGVILGPPQQPHQQPIGDQPQPQPQQPSPNLSQGQPGVPVPAPRPQAAQPNFDQRFAGQPVTPVPGSTLGITQKDVAGEARQKKLGTEEGGNIAEFGKAEAAVKGIHSNLDRLASKASELMNHPGLERITGLVGAFKSIPGTNAANAEALLKSLKAQVGFDTLQAMREASKTGGALGQVSDAEGIRLENALTALDTIQDPVQFKMKLVEIIRYAKEAKQRSFGAFQHDYARLKQGGGATTAPEAPSLLDPLGIR